MYTFSNIFLSASLRDLTRWFKYIQNYRDTFGTAIPQLQGHILQSYAYVCVIMYVKARHETHIHNGMNIKLRFH